MKTIIFLHGFFASGNCIPAKALREAFEPDEQQEQNREIRVLSPDLPIHPKEALKVICELCDIKKPDLLVGNSCGAAFDSETQERMVVYQALYGAKAYWVRPEKMFFEKVTREGKTHNRFTEIDNDD